MLWKFSKNDIVELVNRMTLDNADSVGIEIEACNIGGFGEVQSIHIDEYNGYTNLSTLYKWDINEDY